MTLIDVVVGVAVITTVFFALFGAFKLSVELVHSAKAKTSATALMAERLEYIRSLPYTSVGTLGGIPAGAIPQLEQTTLNGTLFTTRTLILYQDAPEDGVDQNDENGITADYKIAKVEVSWMIKGSSRTTSAVTYLTPSGLETLDGGGTLRVSVFNALASPVPQATVRVINSGLASAIDVSTQTNDSGVASFPGAPEASGYEIYISKNGYSSAQTYGVTEENPNPSPGRVSVVEHDTTSMSFAVDLVGALSFSTFQAAGEESFSDLFDDASKLGATSSTAVSGGSLRLAGASGEYSLGGSAFSVPVSPSYLASWKALSFSSFVPAGTSLLVRLYYFDGAQYTLIPDTDLPGNGAGFTVGPVDLSSLSAESYLSLEIGATLASDGAETPELLEWSVSYIAGPSPLPGVGVTALGSKTIGTTAGGNPIYKFSDSFTTNQLGTWLLEDVEWDAYTISLTNPSSYNVTELCPNSAVVLPGAQTDSAITVTDNSQHSLRLVVEGGGAPVAGASVHIGAGVLSGDGNTSACGQTYFGSLSQTTFNVTVTKSGYQAYSGSASVDGETMLLVPLVSL